MVLSQMSQVRIRTAEDLVLLMTVRPFLCGLCIMGFGSSVLFPPSAEDLSILDINSFQSLTLRGETGLVGGSINAPFHKG